jgi:hypothetical protein
MSNYNMYLTHDNYSHPFCVSINNTTNEVNVFVYEESQTNHLKDNDDYETKEKYTKLIATYRPSKIFIGKSPLNPMTKFSKGYGPNFDGNSILLKMCDDNEYIFIGNIIYSFKTDKEIIEFVSPVGNNDVAYPYAIDNEDNYYFLIEYGILSVDDASYYDDPYTYYYNNMFKIIENAENTGHMYIGNEMYFLNTHPNPAEDYDDLTKRLGSPIRIELKDGTKKIITKNEYIEILENYNKKIGLKPINHVKILHKS